MNPVSANNANSDPLAGFRDIHLPEAIGWWPLAPGWWMLLLLLLILIASLYYYLRWRKVQKSKPVTFSKQQVIKAALLEFNTIEQRHRESATVSDEEARQTVSEISQLLRRCAVQLSSQSDAIAGLTGDAWLSCLDQGWIRNDFTQGAGRMLIDAPYRKVFSKNNELDELLSLCRSWLEQPHGE